MEPSNEKRKSSDISNGDLDENKNNIRKWITSGIDSDAIDFCDWFGNQIAKGELTTSQIRIFYGEMQRIKMRVKDEDQSLKDSEKTAFLMLRPRLAYAVKRHKNKGIEEFYKFFKIVYDCITKCDSEIKLNMFENFMFLFEGILAFHKYYEKNN